MSRDVDMDEVKIIVLKLLDKAGTDPRLTPRILRNKTEDKLKLERGDLNPKREYIKKLIYKWWKANGFSTNSEDSKDKGKDKGKERVEGEKSRKDIEKSHRQSAADVASIPAKKVRVDESSKNAGTSASTTKKIAPSSAAAPKSAESASATPATTNPVGKKRVIQYNSSDEEGDF